MVALTVALGGLGIAGYAFLKKEPEKKRGASPNATATTAAPTKASEPKQTGTVTTQPAPSEVACGGKVPAAADKPKPQFDRAPSPSTINAKKYAYTATIETSCGTIVVELDPANSPNTVASFVFLADKHYFDGLYFHRIATSIDVIQGGDPLGNGTGGPGYSIPDELTSAETYGPGTMAMANSGQNTGGSQFFIVGGPRGHNLDPTPNYTVFGHVTEGLDVVKRIEALPAPGEQPSQAVYIESFTIDASKKQSGSGG